MDQSQLNWLAPARSKMRRMVCITPPPRRLALSRLWLAADGCAASAWLQQLAPGSAPLSPVLPEKRIPPFSGPRGYQSITCASVFRVRERLPGAERQEFMQ